MKEKKKEKKEILYKILKRGRIIIPPIIWINILTMNFTIAFNIF